MMERFSAPVAIAGATAATSNAQQNQEQKETNQDESSEAPKSSQEVKDWEYIRVSGSGFLPGLVCPHHEKIHSNEVLPATDFDTMLKRHPTEVGIGMHIVHWAALLVDEKEGSVLPNGEFSPTRQGEPGIWIKTIVNIDNNNAGGKVVVQSRLCPPRGKLSDLLRHPMDSLFSL